MRLSRVESLTPLHLMHAWKHDNWGVAGELCKIRGAIKIRILFFYPSIAECSQEEENRQ
jgi:hypothetical protein